MSERESMDYDVVIVGAGPAGLASAIHLKQLAQKNNTDISICVLEKGAEVGAHIMSGAVMDTRALSELFPDWQTMGAPVTVPVTQDKFFFLTPKKAYKTPHALLPDCFKNNGNYVVRLGHVVQWLGEQAESLGVDIFPGFAATEILYDDQGAVKGIATGDMGLNRDGTPSANYQPGMELHAKYTLFSEGSRGQLGRQLIDHFNLTGDTANVQSYGIGIKEMWEIDPANFQSGLVIHTAGWPLDNNTYGGSFMYHLDNNVVVIGLVIGLDYKNPYLSPFEEFQRLKTHPCISPYLKGGKRIAYGARSLTTGGLLALPKLVFPGGALVGCEAGFLNASRIKGSHSAIKSGMLCAQAVFEALAQGRSRDELSQYPQLFKESWLYQELNKARNFKAWFKYGLYKAAIMIGIEQLVFRGKMPWSVARHKPDYACTQPASECTPISYPKPDGTLTFDRPSSVFLSNTHHDENEPIHLTLKDPSVPVNVNLPKYAGLETCYCPAGVYEFMKNEQGQDYLQINAQNCLHCKTCDIKDPTQNIVWVAPQGGEGPVYSGM